MYEAHYGLSPRPFGDSTRPGSYVPLASHDAALRRLRYGLDHARGPALLVGPPGTGKTLLARTLARDLGATATHLVFPAMPAPELMAYLADELGAPPDAPGLAGSVRRVRRSLQESALRGRRPLLVIDEAHLIDDPATFEALRLLLNFEVAGAPGLSLLLIGGPDLPFALPPSLLDRLAARATLGPLTRSETSTYVLGRITDAGGRPSLVDPHALAALHRASDGLPRRLNRLADLALLVAYAEGLDRVDAAAVEIAARETSSDPLAA